MLNFAKRGAIGYRVHRGSTYYCPSCDELTKTIWPVDILVLPNHTRCMCFMTPVFADEI